MPLFRFIFILFSCGNLLAQVSLIKGPYLQIGTPNSMIIRWQTNTPTDTKVLYGTNAATLNLSSSSALADTLHEVYLSGLLPMTKYYYAIGTTSVILQSDSNNYFFTSPPHGTEGNYRFWITGDCGNNSINEANVKNAYLYYNNNKHTDGWLLLGDNAYYNGLDAEYNSNFFSYYQGDIMKNTVLWPSPGNHDYANDSLNQNTHNIDYYKIFSLPSGGEAGGVWSGTEAFYSYNYGNVHFVSLDSYGRELNQYRLSDTLGPQTTWLKQDLAANSMLWTVVYFHHPPYTMGSHNSDTEGELDSIRKNLLEILERYSVDFVFCGHSHVYERSKLMKGHFGYELSFVPSLHQLSSSSALYNGSANSCPYIKSDSTRGTLYIVSGSAGSLGGEQASFPHDAMYYSNSTNGGSVIFDVIENRVCIKWLCADSLVRDSFTVFKNVNKTITYSLTVGQTATLSASWPGNYNWSNSADTTREHVITALSDTLFWVNDKYNCVADTFYIKTFTGINEMLSETSFLNLFPNPSRDEVNLQLYFIRNVKVKIQIQNLLGQIVYSADKTCMPGMNIITINNKEVLLQGGVYNVSIESNNERCTKKLEIIK